MSPFFGLMTVLYCAFLYRLSAVPNPPPAILFFAGQDKLMHAVLYAVLAALVWAGLRRAKRAYGPRVLFWVPILFAALYGVSDEIHQRFVPGRSFDVLDMVADAAGALAMQVLVLLLQRRCKKVRTSPLHSS